MPYTDDVHDNLLCCSALWITVSTRRIALCRLPRFDGQKKCDIMKWTQTNPKSQEETFMSIKKGTMPPRYDEAFKSGAIKMVTEQGRPSKEVAAELGICVETLKS